MFKLRSMSKFETDSIKNLLKMSAHFDGSVTI